MQTSTDTERLTAAAPALLEAALEAYHELRIRCGYKDGDHAYEALRSALRQAMPTDDPYWQQN